MQQLATICYLDIGKEFLLLQRNKKNQDVHEGKWIGVGGKVEAGESPEECAIREIFEETGYKVDQKDLELQGFITFPAFTPQKDWYCFVYCIRTFTGQEIDSPEGTLAWVPHNQVLSMPTWDGDRIFLQWVLEGSPLFSAKFSYQNQDLVDWSVQFFDK